MDVPAVEAAAVLEVAQGLICPCMQKLLGSVFAFKTVQATA